MQLPMDNTALQRIQEALNKSENIAIAVGENTSIDEMGAALALYLSLQMMGKNVHVLAPTEPIVELSNLVGINKVKTQFVSNDADLVVSFPYKEGDIEKVSYTIENGLLNIVVKAGADGLRFSERDVKYTRGDSMSGKLDLLFVLGVAKISNIQSLFSQEMLKNVTIVNIDNKPGNQRFGDIIIVSDQLSSISEQVTEILSELRTPVDIDIAQNLLDGIMFATSNFQSANTSSLAFEMSGILMRQGALREKGNRFTKPVKSDLLSRPANYQQNITQPKQNNVNDFRPAHNNASQRVNIPQNQGGYIKPQQPVNRLQNQNQDLTLDPGQNRNKGADLNPPTDWLTPKVYKGSSNV